MTAVRATPGVQYRPPSGQSAATLVRVGIILEMFGAAVLCFWILSLAGTNGVDSVGFAWFALLVSSTVGLAAVGLLCLVYDRAYLPILRGEYRAARPWTRTLGLLSLVFGVVPGVLILVGYSRLEEAQREQQTQWVGPVPVTLIR